MFTLGVTIQNLKNRVFNHDDNWWYQIPMFDAVRINQNNKIIGDLDVGFSHWKMMGWTFVNSNWENCEADLVDSIIKWFIFIIYNGLSLLRFHPFVDLTKQHDQHGDKPLDLRGKPNFSTQTWGRKLTWNPLKPYRWYHPGRKPCFPVRFSFKTIDGQRCWIFCWIFGGLGPRVQPPMGDLPRKTWIEPLVTLVQKMGIFHEAWGVDLSALTCQRWLPKCRYGIYGNGSKLGTLW